jgi:ribosomal protein S18 acetylase RimI-like enzyme
LVKQNLKVTIRGNGFTVSSGNEDKENQSYSFVHGFLGKDGTLYITDASVAPVLRKTGLGKRLVKKLREVTKAKKTYAINVTAAARGFWSRLRIPEGNAKKYLDEMASLREDSITDYLGFKNSIKE